MRLSARLLRGRFGREIGHVVEDHAGAARAASADHLGDLEHQDPVGDIDHHGHRRWRFDRAAARISRLQQKAQLVAAFLRVQLHHVDAEQFVLRDAERLFAGRPENLQGDVVERRDAALGVEPHHPRIELLQFVLERLTTAGLRRRNGGVLKRFHAGSPGLMGCPRARRFVSVVCRFQFSRKFSDGSRSESRRSGSRYGNAAPRSRERRVFVRVRRFGTERLSCRFPVIDARAPPFGKSH